MMQALIQPLQQGLKQLSPTQQRNGVLLLAALMLVVVLSVWWQWQHSVEKQFVQAQHTHKQLLALAQSLPATQAKSLQGDAVLQQIAAQPLTGLTGQISNLRLVGQKVSARVEAAPAQALMRWLTALEQQGVMLSAINLTQPTPGVLSGQLSWGQE